MHVLLEIKDELKAGRFTVISDDEEATVTIEHAGRLEEINIIRFWQNFLPAKAVSGSLDYQAELT